MALSKPIAGKRWLCPRDITPQSLADIVPDLTIDDSERLRRSNRRMSANIQELEAKNARIDQLENKVRNLEELRVEALDMNKPLKEANKDMRAATEGDLSALGALMRRLEACHRVNLVEATAARDSKIADLEETLADLARGAKPRDGPPLGDGEPNGDGTPAPRDGRAAPAAARAGPKKLQKVRGSGHCRSGAGRLGARRICAFPAKPDKKRRQKGRLAYRLRQHEQRRKNNGKGLRNRFRATLKTAREFPKENPAHSILTGGSDNEL